MILIQLHQIKITSTEEDRKRNPPSSRHHPQSQVMEEPPTPNSGGNKTKTEDGDSFRHEISRLLYRPLPRLEQEPIDFSLSAIPWTIQAAQPSTEDGKPSYLVPSYLDLRRRQNLAFCDDQCAKAQREQDPGAWKQALQLVPDHLPSLVGYGRFCLQNNKLEQAEQLLMKSLSVGPNHILTQRLLFEFSEKRRQTNRHQPYASRQSRLASDFHSKPNLKTRESSAYQDALLERQLMASPKDEASEDDKHDPKKHKKKRKKRKEHRKRRRRYYDSSDDDDESRKSDRRRKRKRRRSRDERRHKHRRRSNSDTSES